MIIRMAPEQIAKAWDYIRPGILETMYPVADVNSDSIQRVLRSLLAEDMQLWIGLEDPKDVSDKSVYGFMVTSIFKDVITESRSLIIYSLFETREIPPMVWSLGMRKLKDFAVINKCSSIVAYTDNPRMAEMAKSLGFRPSTFLKKEI